MIEVREPGAQTTVQDTGRCGYLRLGIPPSGPMDRYAFVAANRLAGNDGAAALECTLTGPTLAFQTACAIAVTGADMPLRLNGAPAPAWTTLLLKSGDVLKLGTARAGVRAYIAVSGGIDVPPVLGSRSTYVRGRLGGMAGRALKKGDRLRILGCPLPRSWQLASHAIPTYPGEATVRVVLGPQRARFTPAGIETLLGHAYTLLPQSDRMGARLNGPRIEHAAGHDIISDGIALGAVQVPGDGQPIILLLDRQSTGGYTKAATVCSFDIGRVAQLRPGQSLRFEAIDVAQAHRLLHEWECALADLPKEGLA
jgi:antagonist of KipI